MIESVASSVLSETGERCSSRSRVGRPKTLDEVERLMVTTGTVSEHMVATFIPPRFAGELANHPTQVGFGAAEW